jgi:hypothetical protein
MSGSSATSWNKSIPIASYRYAPTVDELHRLRSVGSRNTRYRANTSKNPSMTTIASSKSVSISTNISTHFIRTIETMSLNTIVSCNFSETFLNQGPDNFVELYYFPALYPFQIPSTVSVGSLPVGTVAIFQYTGELFGKLTAQAIVGGVNTSLVMRGIIVANSDGSSGYFSAGTSVVNAGTPTGDVSATVSIYNLQTHEQVSSVNVTLSGVTPDLPITVNLPTENFPPSSTQMAVALTSQGGNAGDSAYIAHFTLYTKL